MRYRSQSVAYWYFAVAMVLFGLQLVFGLLSAAKYLGPDPLLNILPFDVTKVIHTNLLIVWVLTGFMGATYWMVPDESRTELYSTRLAYVQLVLWTLMGVTAVVGYLFRYGTGNKLLEQPLPHKIVIVICMLIFLYNIGMTIWRSKRFTTTEGVLLLGLGSAAVLYVPALLHYFAILFMVHLEAKRLKLQGMDPKDIPSLSWVLKSSWHLFIPLVVMVTLLLMQFTPFLAAFWGITLTVACSWIPRLMGPLGKNMTGMAVGPQALVQGFEMGAKAALGIGAACACVGFVLGMVLLVGGVGLAFRSRYPVLFLTYLPLLMVAFRYRFGGAAVGVSLFAFIAVASTVAGHDPWVEVADPWLGPITHGCSTVPGLQVGKSVEMDPETMKLALRITYSDEDGLASLVRRVPQRPWYARHLKVRQRQV